MIRNLKSLGLAFVAVLVLGAVAAAAAQADEVIDSSYPATLAGAQVPPEPHKFVGEGGYVLTCNKVELDTTLNAPSTTFTASLPIKNARQNTVA